jgi:hypothetical protein
MVSLGGAKKGDERHFTPSEEAHEALLKIGESALIDILKHPQTALVDV